MKSKFNLKKADFAVLLIILLSAAILFALRADSSAITAEISVDGEIIHTAVLSSVEKPYTVSPDNGTVIEISHDYIRFISSDCSGKDCVRCGKLTATGATAVCIPNKTIIKLSGNSNYLPDALTY